MIIIRHGKMNNLRVSEASFGHHGEEKCIKLAWYLTCLDREQFESHRDNTCAEAHSSLGMLIGADLTRTPY